MPVSAMPGKQYNYPSNTHFNTHNFIETSTVKTISEPLINLAKYILKTVS